MQALALILFAVATLLSFFATPISLSLAQSHGLDAFGIKIGLFFLSVVRGGAMIFGLRAVTSGPTVISTVFAVLAMEVASYAMHMAAADADAYGNTRLQYGFEAIAAILPAILIVIGLFLVLNNSRAPILLSASAVLSVVAGGIGFIVSYSYQNSRNARIEANQKQEVEQNEIRKAELDALPAGTPVEILLAFAAPSESEYIQEHAKFRIIDTERAVEQLKEALNGPHAETAKRIFKEVEIGVYRKKREAEFNAVPVSEGLAAVLSFYAPGEDIFVRGFVEDRFRVTRDAEAQLVKALAGPYALEAIDILRRVDKYRLDDATYDAVFPVAAKVAKRLNSANPPPQKEVEVLTNAIGHMAERSGEKSVKAHREELMTVYQLARRAGMGDSYNRGYSDLELALGLR